MEYTPGWNFHISKADLAYLEHTIVPIFNQVLKLDSTPPVIAVPRVPTVEEQRKQENEKKTTAAVKASAKKAKAPAKKAKAPAKKAKATATKSFAQRLEDLRAYKEKHGHIHVKKGEDKSLYDFCNRIKNAPRDCLTNDRIASLDALGFDWEVKEQKATATKSFAQRLEDLLAYKEKHGHTHVKQKEDKSFYKFCWDMRQARKNPEKSNMVLTADRTASLDALGFDWTAAAAKKSFEQRMEDLQAYKEKNGHFNVKEREDKSLYRFCLDIRRARNNPGKSHHVRINEERIASLDALGFDWTVEKQVDKSYPRHSSGGGSSSKKKSATKSGRSTQTKPKRIHRKCSAPDCTNQVVQGGVCVTHGAKRKLCSYPNCNKAVKLAGFCSTHGPARKKCDDPGCSRVAVQAGKCLSHGARIGPLAVTYSGPTSEAVTYSGPTSESSCQTSPPTMNNLTTTDKVICVRTSEQLAERKLKKHETAERKKQES